MRHSIEPLEHRILMATYYVSVAAGLDTNAGTSISLPFKTIQRAATLAAAGDTILIRGGTYNETVRPARSGTANAPIIYKPYAEETVVINGADPVTGWSQHSGNIFVANLAGNHFSSATPGNGVNLYDSTVGNQANQIFVDQQMMLLARWPNTLSLDVSKPVKALTNTFVSKTRDTVNNWTTGVMTDNDISGLSADSFVGAEIAFQQSNTSTWSFGFSGHVTAKAGSQFTFKSRNDGGRTGNTAVYDPNSRYYIFNKLELLDAPGEWYHDKSTGKLYVWTPNGTSPEGRVLAKKRQYAFDLSQRSYTVIQGLELFATTITTDTASGGDNIGYTAAGAVRYPWRNAVGGSGDATSNSITLDALNVKYPTHYTDISGHFQNQWCQSSGIVLSGSNHIIKNSRIQYSAGNAVSVLGRSIRVYDNEMYDTNYNATNLGAVSMGGTTGCTTDVEVAYNTIRRTGKHGIQYSYLTRTSVTDGSTWKGRLHHNEISEFAIQDPDTGAFYAASDSNFIRIDHNWIYNPHPNVDSIPGAGNYTVSGVYSDYGRNLIVDHNVIWDVEWGIHLQNQTGSTANYLVYNNTVRVKRTASFVTYGPFGIVKNSSANLSGTVIRNNIFSNADAAPGYRASDITNDTGANRIYSENLEWNSVPGSPTDPKFTSLLKPDFSLQPGSAAIDTGVTIPTYLRNTVNVPAFNDAFLGSPDRGAYEAGMPFWTPGRRTTPPTLLTPAAGSPNPVSANTTTLTVTATDEAGEPWNSYHWSLLSGPSGAPTPTFSINATNASRSTLATLYQAGTYVFRATITDRDGNTTTSDASIQVLQSAASLSVSPAGLALAASASYPFTAAGIDQFGLAMTVTSPAWSATGGTIDSTGLFTAGTTAGTFSVTATLGSLSAQATGTVFFTAPTSVLLTAASDTGAPGDNLTNLNNSAPARSLSFVVTGTTPTATVSLYLANTLLGTAVATGPTTTITTNGLTAIPDGTWAVSATQSSQTAAPTSPSPALTLTVDATAPTFVFSGLPVDVTGNPIPSVGLLFSEAAYGLTTSSLLLTRDNEAAALAAPQTPTTDNQTFWTIPNLSLLTQNPGSYTLNLAAAGITDAAGNVLSAAAAAAWIKNTLIATSDTDDITLNFTSPTTAVVIVNSSPAYALNLAPLGSLVIDGGNIATIPDALHLTGAAPSLSTPLRLRGNFVLAALPPTGTTLTAFGTGTVISAPSFSLDALHLESGATARTTTPGIASFLNALTLAPGATFQLSGGILSTSMPDLSAGSLLELVNADLIVHYATSSPITDLLAAYADGRITAPGDFGGLPTYVGISEAADLGLTDFAAIPVDDTTLIAKYTFVGDANLDGQVDALDYERVDLAIGNSGVLGVAQGDLNYDGTVDSLDYEQVDLNVGNGVGSPLAPVLPPPTATYPTATHSPVARPRPTPHLPFSQHRVTSSLFNDIPATNLLSQTPHVTSKSSSVLSLLRPNS